MSATVKKVEIKERPIIFSGPMVKAILEGRKTQTRRVLDPQPLDVITKGAGTKSPSPVRKLNGHRSWCARYGDNPVTGKMIYCRYGEIGDRLWVRETWQPIRRNSPEQDAKIKASLDRLERGEVKDIVAEVQGWPFPPNGDREVLYAADFGDWAYDVDSDLKPWKSPLFLPRNLSRITLEVTNVRVERLQDISASEAKAEGVEPFLNRDATAWRAGFQIGWDAINAKRGYSWSSNPFVWVIEFRKL